MTAPAQARATQESSVAGFSRRQLTTVLGALILAVLLAALDTTIVTTALPTIAGEFNAFESFAWVGSAYIVASTVATPILGKLSDLYGRRVIFQTTMVVFLIGSLLCGVAQSMPQLIAFRAVQGLGGGAIQALAFAIVGDILSPRERGRYIGFFTMAFAAAALAGPLVGGFIIDRWSWHWIFLINVPLVLVAGAATHFTLRLPFKRRDAKVDWTGATLLVIGLGSLMISLERGRSGWARPPIIIGFAIAVVFLVAFVLRQRTAPEPMIPLRLFSNRVVLASCGIGFLLGSVSYGATTFLPLYFQDALFVSPTQSGLRMMPVMVGVVISSFGAGRLIARIGRYKIYPVAGTAAMGLGLVAIAQITGGTAYAMLIGPMFVIGLGSGASYTTTSIMAQNACELRDLGVTTATVMFARSLGGSIGLASYGAVLNSIIRRDLPARTGLSADAAVKLIRTPAEIHALEPDTRRAVIDALANGVGTIQLIASVAMGLAFIWALTVPEIPLRHTAGIKEAMAAE